MAYMNCDVCDKSEYTDDNPFVEMRQQRPSDHSDMCCTFAGHAKCLGYKTSELPSIDATGGIATRAQWNEWIESAAAHKAGYVFLT